MLGSVNDNLEFLEVGGLNHSHSLTLGFRILRFYVAQKKPTSNLSPLAEFLIKVFFPVWFQIIFNNKITDGPKNYLNILTQVMGFPNKIIQDIAVAVSQRNAYFAQHENILLAMLADNDCNVRLLAVNKTLSIRISRKNLDDVGRDEEIDVRKFIIPKININAKTKKKNLLKNDHQHRTVPNSNLLHHVNNPRPISTLLSLSHEWRINMANKKKYLAVRYLSFSSIDCHLFCQK